MMEVCLGLLPATSTWSLGRVGYCAALVAQLCAAGCHDAALGLSSKANLPVEDPEAQERHEQEENCIRSLPFTVSSNLSAMWAHDHCVEHWWKGLSWGVDH